MTWVRAGQLTGEIAEEHTGYSGSSSFTLNGSVQFTGGYSYRQNYFGETSPSGIAGLDADTVRAHMMFRSNGVNSASTPYGVIGMVVEGAPLAWGYAFGAGDLNLRAGHVAGATTQRFISMGVKNILPQNNVWYSVGMVACLAAVDGFVSLYVEGERIARWEGDTRLYRSGQTTPRTRVNAVYIAGIPTYWGWGSVATVWAQYPYVDDFYVDVWEGEGAPVDKAPSLRRFLAARPNGPGSSTKWTPEGVADNYDAVNDETSDADATVVKSVGPGMLDLYQCEDVVLPVDHAVRAVIPSVVARKTDTGVGSTLKVALSDGVDVVTSGEKELGAAYRTVWERWKLAPDGEPWTANRLVEMQIGMESSGVFDDEE